MINSCFFAWGVEDVRAGRAPAFDDRTVPPKDWPTARIAVLGRCPITVNDVVTYERGRAFGVLSLQGMSLKVRGRG